MADTLPIRAEYAAGSIAGIFRAQPKGIILHGSRSGKRQGTMAEYIGTVNWAQINPEGLGWNATIGPAVYATHFSAKHWGWNAREHSPDYLAVEFAQPTIQADITDAQVAAFAEWYRVHVRPAWPNLTPRALVLPMHSELPAGKRDGKSDAFMPNSERANDLRRRIYAALEGQMQENPPAVTVGPGIVAAMKRQGETPISNEEYVKAPDGRDLFSFAVGSQGGFFVWVAATDSVHRAPRV